MYSIMRETYYPVYYLNVFQNRKSWRLNHHSATFSQLFLSKHILQMGNKESTPLLVHSRRRPTILIIFHYLETGCYSKVTLRHRDCSWASRLNSKQSTRKRYPFIYSEKCTISQTWSEAFHRNRKINMLILFSSRCWTMVLDFWEKNKPKRVSLDV